MYPNLYYAFKDLFSIELPFLKVINTSGFFIALGILTGAFFWNLDLKRKQRTGELVPLKINKIEMWPADVVPGASLLAAVTGVIGCKVFDILDNWNRFVQNPPGALLSTNGWTIYGGFIFATITLWFSYSQWGKYRMRMTDPIAPALMIGYAVGRFGCHVSGDGDWGIVNNKAKAVSWLPDWLWAYNYPHNIIKQGIYMPGCNWGDYCYRLAVPVYPTAVYETLLCIFFFIILWNLRKRLKIAGRLSSIYLIFNGLERFLIEPIRINFRHDVFGLHATQAQIISVLFIIAGIVLYLLAPRLRINNEISAP